LLVQLLDLFSGMNQPLYKSFQSVTYTVLDKTVFVHGANITKTPVRYQVHHRLTDTFSVSPSTHLSTSYCDAELIGDCLPIYTVSDFVGVHSL